MSSRFLFIFGAAALLAASACQVDGPREASEQASAEVGETDAPAGVCATGFAGFQSEFLPKVQNEVCKTCHKGANPNAPPWLVGADDQVYLNAKNYVNFADLDNSRLVIRAGNLHCGGGCNEEMRARMKGYLQGWYNGGESTCDRTTVIRTQPVAVPADLPSDRFVSLAWDLTAVDVTLRGVKLTVEIKKFTDAAGPTPGSYVIRKPRFVGTRPTPIVASHLRILVNNNFQEAANQFERVDTVASPDVMTGTTFNYPILSPEQSFLVEEHPGTDKLTATFEKLTKTDRRMCKSVDTFVQKVKPTVEARGCLGCHTPGATAVPAAVTKLDMSGGDQELCAKFLGRTWSNTDVLPALIQYPLFGRFEHPRVFVGAKDVLPDWTDWMQAEWQ